MAGRRSFSDIDPRRKIGVIFGLRRPVRETSSILGRGVGAWTGRIMLGAENTAKEVLETLLGPTALAEKYLRR